MALLYVSTRFHPSATLFGGAFVWALLSGCSSQPPLPERAADSPAAVVPPVSTGVVPVTLIEPIEPARLQSLDSTPAAATPIFPVVKPSKEWSEQELAADALGRIGPVAVPALREALANKEPDVRLQATEVLARMGPDAKEAVPDLIRLLDDPDDRVRRAATRTLGRIGPDASPAVPGLMRSLLTPDS